MKGDLFDPKGLVFEAYRIDGITYEECRSIFLDWALSLPVQDDAKESIRVLLEKYQPDNSDHPMTAVLSEGLEHYGSPRRRGGWRGRSRPEI